METICFQSQTLLVTLAKYIELFDRIFQFIVNENYPFDWLDCLQLFEICLMQPF